MTEGPNDMFGVFSEQPGVFVGDPYAPDSYKLSRYKGKGFYVPAPATGAGSDAMLDRTTKLTVPGDVYVDPYRLTQEGKTTTIHGKAFVPVGPSKKPSGAGSLYGLLGPGLDLLDTDASLATRSRRDAVEKKRSIYVSPAKKGTFGFPIQERSIGGTRFEFIPDEFERGRILEKQMKLDARAKFNKPFVSTGRTGRGIVPISPATGGLAERPKDETQKDASGRKPWKASNPPPKGRGNYGCLSPIPYVPCPEAPKTRAEEKGEKPSTKAFKTTSTSHKRLSMWSPNPYQYAARPPPDNDMSLLG